LSGEAGRPGRRKIYESPAAKKRAERARIKAAGCREIRISVQDECKDLFIRFCSENNMSQAEALFYLLELHYGFSESTPRM